MSSVRRKLRWRSGRGSTSKLEFKNDGRASGTPGSGGTAWSPSNRPPSVPVKADWAQAKARRGGKNAKGCLFVPKTARDFRKSGSIVAPAWIDYLGVCYCPFCYCPARPLAGGGSPQGPTRRTQSRRRCRAVLSVTRGGECPLRVHLQPTLGDHCSAGTRQDASAA